MYNCIILLFIFIILLTQSGNISNNKTNPGYDQGPNKQRVNSYNNINEETKNKIIYPIFTLIIDNKICKKILGHDRNRNEYLFCNSPHNNISIDNTIIHIFITLIKLLGCLYLAVFLIILKKIVLLITYKWKYHYIYIILLRII
jgi:hypothetical protein